MKKLVITFILNIAIVHLYGQDTLQSKLSPQYEKKHLNELGLDMTPFIKFYFRFSDNDFYSFQPNYMLTYRRYLKKGNFRAALGGNYIYTEIPSPYNGDSLKIKYYSKQSSLFLRVGYEFFQDLSKHWQVYYGADILGFNSKQRNDAPYWNGGYANGIESSSTGLGVAPLLGIRFKINKRISITTESSFLIQYSKNSSRRYYLPVTSGFPPKADDPSNSSKTIGTTFNYPLSLILTINI